MAKGTKTPERISGAKYKAVIKDLMAIKRHGMYGYLETDENDNIIREVKDGRPFEISFFERNVVNRSPIFRQYYYLPAIIRKSIRRSYYNATDETIRQRINKLKHVKKMERNFLLKHQIELDELTKIIRVNESCAAIESFCYDGDAKDRYREYMRVEYTYRHLRKFIKHCNKVPPKTNSLQRSFFDYW